MPATTPIRGLPYPVGTDPIDVQGDIQRLAMALDTATMGGVALDAWPVGSIFIGVTPTNPSTLLGGGTWTAFGTGRTLVGVNAADPTMDAAEKTGGAATAVLVTANMPAHAHTMAHTHTIDHNHATATSAVASVGHTHTIDHNHATATSSSAGNHEHDARFNSPSTANVAGTGGYYWARRWVDSTGTVVNGITNTVGAHTHTVDLPAFAGSSGGQSANHTHTVDLPAFTGSSGAASAANTGSVGTATAFSVLDPFIAVYMWKRTA